MSRFHLTIRAQRDLDEIVVYVGENGGPGVARRVLTALKKAMRILARHPNAGQIRDDLTDKPYRFWSVFFYYIVYDASTRPIVVIRVIHGARETRRLL